jgi:hypothetical protein
MVNNNKNYNSYKRNNNKRNNNKSGKKYESYRQKYGKRSNRGLINKSLNKFGYVGTIILYILMFCITSVALLFIYRALILTKKYHSFDYNNSTCNNNDNKCCKLDTINSSLKSKLYYNCTTGNFKNKNCNDIKIIEELNKNKKQPELFCLNKYDNLSPKNKIIIIILFILFILVLIIILILLSPFVLFWFRFWFRNQFLF